MVRSGGSVSYGVQVMSCGHFQKKYEFKEWMELLCMDELLSGIVNFA